MNKAQSTENPPKSPKAEKFEESSKGTHDIQPLKWRWRTIRDLTSGYRATIPYEPLLLDDIMAYVATYKEYSALLSTYLRDSPICSRRWNGVIYHNRKASMRFLFYKSWKFILRIRGQEQNTKQENVAIPFATCDTEEVNIATIEKHSERRYCWR